MLESSNPKPFLTPNQRRLVSAALALTALSVIVVFFYGVFLLLQSFVTEFSGVLWPLAAAGILALILRPVVEFFEQRTRMSRLGAIVLLYVLVVLVLTLILVLVLPVLFQQAVRLIEFLPAFVEDVRVVLTDRNPEVQAFLEKYVGVESIDRIRETVTANIRALIEASVPAFETLKGWIAEVVAWAAGLAIIPIYLFFFLETRRDVSADLREQLSFIRPDWRDDAVFLIREFVGSIVAFFRGQLVIALIMGVLFAIGFTAVGVNFGLVLGLAMGFLNVIPYLGSIIGLATVLPIAFFQPEGGPVLVALAMVVFVIVQMIEGYLLTPRIMGRTTGLHPLVIIIAIFFWGTALDGILGMILAIPLTAFFVVAWRLLKKKYFESWSGAGGADPADDAPKGFAGAG